jgi:putative peptide zinc metalloprotease protein
MNIRNIEISRQEDIGGSACYLVGNRDNSRYVRMGGRETRFLLSMLESASAEQSREFESYPELNDKEKEFIKKKFYEWGFLSDGEKTGSGTEAVSEVNLKKIHLFTFPVDRILRVFYPQYRWLLSRSGFYMTLLILTADLGLIQLLFFRNELTPLLAGFHPDAAAILIFAVYFLVNTFFHELGHAAACRKSGVRVNHMGLLLYYLVPAFFCDVSEIYKVNDRKKRAVTASAGILTNLFIASVTAYLALFMIYTGVSVRFASTLLTASFIEGVFSLYNLIPLVKMDGYWLLSSVLGIENLQEKSWVVLYTSLARRDRLKDLSTGRWMTAFLSAFGLLSLGFSEVFWIMTYSLVRRMFGGYPVLLWAAAAMLIVYFVLDLIVTIRQFKRAVTSEYERLIRWI